MTENPRRIPLLAAVLGVLSLLQASAAHAWPSAIASSFEERAKSVATDRDGNTYVTGTFDGVLSVSDRTVTSNGERDVFVAKLNQLGTVVWLASAGSDLDDEVGGIGVDNGGNVYVAGTFFKSLFFTADENVADPVDLTLTASSGQFTKNPNPQSCSPVTVTTTDAFVAKLDKDGKWLWAARAGSKGFDRANDLALHPNGVYVTGSYANLLSFADAGSAPAPPVPLQLPVPTERIPEADGWDGPLCVDDDLRCPTEPSRRSPGRFALECQRRSDMFVARIGFDGKWTWAVRGGGQVNSAFGDAIAVDAGRNIYVVGKRAPATVSSTTGTQTSFLVRVEDAGTGGQVLHRIDNLRIAAADVATDGLGNVIVGGTSEGPITIGGTSELPIIIGETQVQASTLNPAAVIARYSDTGTAFAPEWVSQARPDGFECDNCPLGGSAAIRGLAFDGAGEAFVSGHFGAANIRVRSDFELIGPSTAYASVSGTLDGWSEGGNGVLHLGTLIRAYSGRSSLGLNDPGAGTLSRTLSTVAGHRYLIRFALTGIPRGEQIKDLRVNWEPPTQGVNVFCRTLADSRRVQINNALSNSFLRFNTAGLSLSEPGWEEIECAVTASSSQTTLLFGSLTNGTIDGPVIDDIRVIALDTDQQDFPPGGRLSFDQIANPAPDPLPASDVWLQPFASQSDTDIFVASLDADGQWHWASRAGGAGAESAVAIAAANAGELVTVGDFADSASFENPPPNESGALGAAGGGDAFAARVTDEGQWVAFQKWVVGQEVPRPAGACGPGNTACPTPRQPIVDLGGGNLSPDASFLWSAFDGKLYAIGPVSATVKWFELPGQQVPTKFTTGTADFPGAEGRGGSVQTHIATAPVDVELSAAVQRCGAGGDHPFYACRDEQNNPTTECGTSPSCGSLANANIYSLIVRDGNKPSFTNSGARIIVDSQKKVFDSSLEGHSVLVYVNAPNPDPSQGTIKIDVVRTIAPQPEQASCAIGTPLADPAHRDPSRRNGWVLNPASRYDGVGTDRAHDRARRAGPIIPVNEDAPADESDDMLVAWYRQNDRGIAWPEVVLRYDCSWPNGADKIVIASGVGSDQGQCAGAAANRGGTCENATDCSSLLPPPPFQSFCTFPFPGQPGFCAPFFLPCFSNADCAQPTCRLQPALDPALFSQARIYDQPNREDASGTKLPGFNPNEEHALLAPSNAGFPSPAVFALRCDLGDPKGSDINDLSEPYVLLKYREPQSNEWRMKVYEVKAEEVLATFDYDVEAGEQIQPPYPLTLLPPCAESCAPNVVDCGGENAVCQASTRSQCVGGDRAGVRCDVADECPDGTCEVENEDRCSGGSRHGEICAADSDCMAGPTCDTSTMRCSGGSLDGDECSADADCESECPSLCGAATSDNLPLFKDYRGVGADGTWTGWWSRAAGKVQTQFFYPLQNGFYSKGLDLDHDGTQDDAPGTCVPWLDRYAETSEGALENAPVTVSYNSEWPASPPQLEVGQTLLRPSICSDPSGGSCLPNIADQAAAEVIFEQRNDRAMPQNDRGDLVRLFDPLAERAVFLRQIADDLTTDRDGARTVITGNIDGDKIPFALRRRLSFEPGPFSICDGGVTDALACVRTDAKPCPGEEALKIPDGKCLVGGRLRFRGVFDDSNLGEPLLLPNVVTDAEWSFLRELSGESGFKTAVDNLYRKTRNPNGVKRAGSPDTCHHPEISGACPLEVGFVRDAASGVRPENVLETKALSAGDPRSEGFLTVIFNNERTLSPAPVTAKVIRLGCSPGPYQGQVQVIQPDNVFDEQLTLRHNGDFGGDPSRLNFDWFYALKEKDCPSIQSLPYASRQAPGNGEGPSFPWLPLASGNGVVEVTLKGAALTTLADTCVFTRYTGYAMCENTAAPSQWAGAPLGSPTQVTNPKSQLAPGWLARVVRALNPFDSRTKDFRQSPVNTFASMITQAGKRYEGDIAFNGSAENLNRIGLIEAYETVLRRGLDLSVNNGLNVGAVNNKLLDVSSRLSGIFMLLGNEAFSDAQDPTIGFDTSSEFGSLAPAIFSFQDQTDSLLSEELSLLRGRDDGSGPTPIYNRLIWNFTGGTGQVAYQQNYNVRDQDQDGFINENDARALFPQGHGDAWGHYLTAVKSHYRLLRHPNFRWAPRSDSVLVAGSEVLVDFTDERKFADAAAARARAGAQIVDLTYRQRWVDDPNGQWQGYKDTDPERAFGVAEWAARAGQGAYFDWVVANGILPPASDKPPGIERIDRTTVPELHEIVSQFNDVQAKLDQVDAGLNPVGLAKNVVPFDIDPTFLDTGSTTSVGTRAIQGLSHFEQIYERANGAFKNAVRVFDNANSLTALLRKNQDSVDDFRQNVVEQERDYNNRLIEIFGSPYPEDIGPGKTYPSGYAGPDLWNFDIVEQSELTGGEPGEVEGALVCSDGTEDFAGFPCSTDTDCPGGECKPGGDFTEFSLTSVVPAMLDCNNADRDDVNNTCRLDDESGRFEYDESGFPKTVEGDVAIRLSNAGFGRVKDPSWTRRLSPGEMQMARSDLVQALGQFRRAVADHQRAVNLIECDLSSIRGQNKQAADVIEVLEIKRDTKIGLGAGIAGAKAAQLGFARAGTILEKAAEAASESLPKIVGLSNDPTSPARGIIKSVATSAFGIVGFAADAAELLQTALEQAQNAQDDVTEVKITGLEQQTELFGLLGAIFQHVKEEAVARAEALTALEAVRQAQAKVDSTLAEGLRHYDELIAFRKKTAAQVADTRYNDMAFRIFRNDALQKYKAQFDLTTQYVYLAATAYDYETNLLGTENNAGRRFLTDIVRHRSLGQVVDNEPIVGSRGLADSMARMRANFEVIDSQLGFNNPQTESNRFSLRRELFRVLAPESFCDEGDDACEEENSELLTSSNEKWREMLERHRIPDLWRSSDFRRFARPFAPESNGAQPAIVIPFDTNVISGLNFFGWPLAGGDSSYDPTSFSTKVRSVGVWFGDYSGRNLSNTPRVYLIPVGADVLRPVSAFDFTPREFLIFDQKIPVPLPIGATDLTDRAWSPMLDSLGGSPVEIRRYDALRAYHDSGFTQDELSYDSRSVGRSVWNTRWVLIIPGATLLSDAEEGLNRIIYGRPMENGPVTDPNGIARDGAGISDIQMFFQTYAYSGN